MRPGDKLLIFGNALALLVLTAPLPDTLRWMRYIAPIVLLAAPGHALLAGRRWQMVPAYLLTGLLFIAWLPVDRPGGDGSMSWAAIGLGILGLVVSISLPALVPVFRFPQPGGPYAVGTLTYHWVDPGRTERFADDPTRPRELMVQVWYPATDDPSVRCTPYVPDPAILAPLARLLHLPQFILGHVHQIVTNAIPAAPVSNGAPNYPVLLFSHGKGGFRQHSTWTVEELVSQGYIVAAIDHPYAACGVRFPDGRLVPIDSRMMDRAFEDAIFPYLAQDAVFTLNQLTAVNQADPNGILTGKLDLQHAGIFGLSMGGEVTAEACRQEPRFRACLIMDVWMPDYVVRDPMKQPTMWITRNAETMRLERWREADIEETLTTMRQTYESQPGPGYFVQVPGMFHLDFTDTRLLSPLTSWLGLSGPMGLKRAHAIISAYALAFFDRYLKGFSAPLLDGPPEEYPEVRFESRPGRN